MSIDHLREAIALQQKRGLPFIIASVIIWGMIAFVAACDFPIATKNIFVFFCACPLLPLAWGIGKTLDVDIFSKQNPLGQAGFLFTLNQALYLLIVMWVFQAVPDKMIMVYAMVFGAHLLPYSWLYCSKGYTFFAVTIPILSLVVGNLWSGFAVAVMMIGIEILFVIVLLWENKRLYP
uniref:DUF7010 family protein n=1 Tax=Ndongobacter massiliensis TaxID=1871025 RepID=UPI000931E1F1|nr:hypothetical protein [Ndongobacter massiliensis]